MIPAYNSIQALGSRFVADICDGPVVIEEKVDGSQFSFCKTDSGAVHFRSKGTEIFFGAPSMFSKGMESVLAVQHMLTPGTTYRGEYLMKPKHNSLAYDRVPDGHIAIFEIEDAQGNILPPDAKAHTAAVLGFESVPTFAFGPHGPEEYRGFVHGGSVQAYRVIDWAMQQTSFLGGQKVEGVVVKNYFKVGPDKKFMVAKLVSDEFKEVHRREWKTENPGRSDIVTAIIAGLKTPARWNKAIQHLRDDGNLLGAPQDIGILLKEIQTDTKKDVEADVKDALFNHFWPQISRGICSGFPEYYKAKLNEQCNRPTGSGGSGDSHPDQPKEQTIEQGAEASPVFES